ncbi:prolyl oligopeptidase family serine peptidase [Micromonospora sp. CPCC 206060]|uniref:S9 family peptidase n=1 Tax=Micromonospora sp. CPCC 206060 TaxID=3122406 RepID=UPI002FF2BE61
MNSINAVGSSAAGSATGDVVPAAAAAVAACVGYDQLRSVDGGLYWLESRPGAGAEMLVRWAPATGPVDLTPAEATGVSTVHTYGGGSYAVIGDEVWFAGRSGLHRIRDGEVAAVIDGSFADLTPGEGELLGVCESADSDELVAVPLTGIPEPRVLAESSGFFGAPRLGPGLLAWSWWSKRDMPWDGCELWVAAYDPGDLIGHPVKIAGGPDESAIEPRWGPDGALYFVSDRSGWWNLYRWDGSSVVAVAPMAAECAAAPWELGYASYGFLGDGRVVMVVQEGPRHRLVVVDPDGVVVDPDGAVQPVRLPYTSIKPYLAVHGDAVAVVGASPAITQQVALVHLDGAAPQVEVLTPGTPVTPDGSDVSTPVQLRVPVGGDREVVALLYPPTGAGSGWRAPLIVRAHPGPTVACQLRLDWQTQFFTSRGFAVADVDYTGSTGYGRAFRQALHGRWGVDDVDDCRAVAEHLVAAGSAAPGQVFIRGASAGGYTALHAVTGDTPFAAATVVSAIVDPDRWASAAPRFHRAHAARLCGGAGRVRAADIRRPVLFVHGTADEVAAVDDVRLLAAELEHHAVRHELVLLDGVGHGVAASAQAAAALAAELAHYRSVIDGSQEA